jgi:hypothetical protein
VVSTGAAVGADEEGAPPGVVVDGAGEDRVGLGVLVVDAGCVEDPLV